MNVKQIGEELSGYRFLPEGGRACFWYTHYEIIKQFTELGEPWSINFGGIDTSFAGYSQNHFVKWYFPSKDENHFLRFLERYIKEPELFSACRAWSDNVKKAIVGGISKAGALSSLGSAELLGLLSRYFQTYRKFFKVSATMRTLDRGVMMYARGRFPADEADRVLGIISTPTKPSFVMEEELALAALAKRLKGESKSPSSLSGREGIADLCRRFAWSGLGYFNERPRVSVDYEKRLAALLEGDPEAHEKELRKGMSAGIEERAAFVRSLPERDRAVAFIASEASFYKDYSKANINEAQYRAESLFEEVARRAKLKADYIKELTLEEIESVLNGRPVDESLVNRRTEENLIVALDGELAICVGSGAAIFKEMVVGLPAESKREFSGRAASAGKALGRAAVVRDAGDFSKVRQGDVLVVMNTSPDFLPLFKKISGIVAEEGGLTAHVSVVSREFRIPCVVGIRHAVDMFRDGDLVEVDAERGVVTILKRPD